MSCNQPKRKRKLKQHDVRCRIWDGLKPYYKLHKNISPQVWDIVLFNVPLYMTALQETVEEAISEIN